ncbi:hypothetical protein [Paraglaciecola algarum]|uniref:hypothetical protein n=1 Tax=Paraglaciecola algarum TaxID=3050085 RepID=UPI001F37F80F|nr:hypothetical protein [Paraglaciecola sp. G1-23]
MGFIIHTRRRVSLSLGFQESLVDTFKGRSVELFRLSIWLLISLSIIVSLLIYPDKKMLLLGMFIGPINMLFKMNQPLVLNKFTKLFFVFFGTVLIYLMLNVFFPLEWLPEVAKISDTGLIYLTSVCLLIIFIVQYISKLRQIMRR